MTGFGHNFGYEFGVADDRTMLIGFITGENNGTYHLTTTGSVSPMTTDTYHSKSGQPVRATSNFEIQELPNGHTYVTGSSGNGYGDAFEVTGRIVDLGVEGDMYVEVDKKEVEPSDLYGNNEISLMDALNRLREFYQTGE